MKKSSDRKLRPASLRNFQEHLERLFKYVLSLHKSPSEHEKSVTRLKWEPPATISEDTTEKINWDKPSKPDFFLKYGKHGEIVVKDFGVLSSLAIEGFMRGVYYLEKEIEQAYKRGEIKSPADVRRIVQQHKLALKGLSRLAHYKFQVANYLSSKFPELDISPENLFELDEKIKQEGKKYLRKELRGSLQADNIIREVFRKPRKSQRRVYIEMIAHIPP